MKSSFDSLFAKARRVATKHGGDVTVNLPFLSITVTPQDVEKRTAREVLIRLTDKRVLCAKECCGGCIESALASLQEIRSVLVDKQVELSAISDGSVYLILEFMAEGTRQFLTATERLSNGGLPDELSRRNPDVRERYFQFLEQLRFHFHSCLQQLSTIAELPTPKVEGYLRSGSEWELAHYGQPKLPAP